VQDASARTFGANTVAKSVSVMFTRSRSSTVSCGVDDSTYRSASVSGMAAHPRLHLFDIGDVDTGSGDVSTRSSILRIMSTVARCRWSCANFAHWSLGGTSLRPSSAM